MFHTSRTTPYKSSAIFAPIPTWLGGGEPAFRAYNTLAYTVVDQLLIIILTGFLAVVEHFGQQSDMRGLKSNLTISKRFVLRELDIITSSSFLRTAVKFDPKCGMG
jgi:hypothetical protein